MIPQPARLGLVVAAVIVALDQASKAWVFDWLDAGARSVEVTSFFNVVLVRNRGASFGLFGSDSAWTPWLLSAFALAVMVVLVVWLFRAAGGWLGVALGLIIGGAIGNLIDRASTGAVVDFLDFHLANAHWPAFNLADSAITVGVVMVLIETLIGRRGDRTVAREAEERGGGEPRP